MHITHYSDDPQLAGFGSFLKKLTKPVTSVLKKVAAPVLSLQKKIDNKLIATFVPKKLEPLATRIAASTQRVTELTLVPTNAPAIIKAEVKQMKDAAKDPQFMKLVGTIMSVVALVYPFLRPIAAAMSALQAAAEITAAKKLNAKNEAEAQAAQAEFDSYAKQLADAVQEGERLKAAQQAAIAAAQAQGKSVVAVPQTSTSPLLTTAETGFFAPGGEGFVATPQSVLDAAKPYLIPAAIGVATIGVIALARRRQRSQ